MFISRHPEIINKTADVPTHKLPYAHRAQFAVKLSLAALFRYIHLAAVDNDQN
jgi:hypothetical protein